MIYNYNLAFIHYNQGTRQYNNIVLIAFRVFFLRKHKLFLMLSEKFKCPLMVNKQFWTTTKRNLIQLSDLTAKTYIRAFQNKMTMNLKVR